jgi:myo-inositol-1(or 4)-monophosphatase
MSRDLVDVAEEAALAGGRVVRGGRWSGAPAEVKGAGDYVTEVDRASERAIATLLGERTPHIPVVGEEAGGSPGPRYWLVDPLDGTANFLHGFPLVGVSVALVEDDQPVAGAVHAPFLAETYVAGHGLGAWRVEEHGERTPLRVSDRPVERSIVGTGFPFRRKQNVPRYLPVFARCFERFEDLRRPGAASLDLAWVAAGIFEGFFELGLGPWDVAAGGVLIREAGGVVTDWAGEPGFLSGDVLAGTPGVHAELLRIAREAGG